MMNAHVQNESYCFYGHGQFQYHALYRHPEGVVHAVVSTDGGWKPTVGVDYGGEPEEFVTLEEGDLFLRMNQEGLKVSKVVGLRHLEGQDARMLLVDASAEEGRLQDVAARMRRLLD